MKIPLDFCTPLLGRMRETSGMVERDKKTPQTQFENLDTGESHSVPVHPSLKPMGYTLNTYPYDARIFPCA